MRRLLASSHCIPAAHVLHPTDACDCCRTAEVVLVPPGFVLLADSHEMAVDVLPQQLTGSLDLPQAFLVFCKVGEEDVAPVDVPSADARLNLQWTGLVPTSIRINGITGMVAEDGSTLRSAASVQQWMRELGRTTGVDQKQPLALVGSPLTPGNLQCCWLDSVKGYSVSSSRIQALAPP